MIAFCSCKKVHVVFSVHTVRNQNKKHLDVCDYLQCQWTNKHDKNFHLYSLFFSKNTGKGALCHQHAGSSHCLDLLLGLPAEELRLDYHWLLGKFPFAQNFVVALLETTVITINIKSTEKKITDSEGNENLRNQNVYIKKY